MAPLEGQLRHVYFVDTPDLPLNQHGVIVRAHHVQPRGDDSVIKLRPAVPDELPAGLRQSGTWSWRWTPCRAGTCVRHR
jgi:hypothetical protein